MSRRCGDALYRVCGSCLEGLWRLHVGLTKLPRGCGEAVWSAMEAVWSAIECVVRLAGKVWGGCMEC